MKKKRCNIIPDVGWEKLFLMARITAILLFAGLMQVTASVYSQKTRLDLKLENAPVESVLRMIEDQSGFYFLYRSDNLEKIPNVDLDVKKATLEEVLNRVIVPYGFDYEVDDRVVVIKKAVEKEPLENPVEQPERQIRGTVKDVSGNPIPGVSVFVEGTTIGTVTNADGEFLLRIPVDAATLQFSFVGMKTRQVPVGAKSVVNVTMEEETTELEEVVAVGYGVQKKESVVGSIVQTQDEELRRSGNTTSVEQALTGLLPGVTSILSTGEPGGVGNYQMTAATGWNPGAVKRSGSASTIFIRGQNTWNGGNPLVLVDGVERNMDNVDVNEVDKISVLKDASATAVFGVRGANGVILITTKRGAVGKPVISFNYQSTAMILSKVPEMLHSYDAIMIRNEAIERELAINPPSWAEYRPHGFALNYKRPVPHPVYEEVFPDVNWKDAVFKDAGFAHRANLSVKGGSGFVRYFGSFAYMFEDDMYRKDYDNGRGYTPSFAFNRFNFRSNFDFTLTKTTNMELNLSGFYARKNQNYAGVTDFSWIYGALYGAAPNLFPPQYSDGYWGVNLLNEAGNPLSHLYNLGIFKQRETELNIDVSLTQNLDFITPGLSVRGSFSLNNNLISTGGLWDNAQMARTGTGTNTQSKVIDPTLFTGPDQDPAEYTSYLPVTSLNRTYYDFWVEPWSLRPENVEGSLLYRSSLYQFQVDYSRKFGNHNLGLLGLFKRENYAWGSEFEHYREDWVFRATYDYDSRYLFETNGAYNGSEQFGPGYRFDFFPSVALGWNISNEKFFRIDWMNRLKLRASAGMVGNDDLGAERWLYADQIVYAAYAGAVPMDAADVRLGRSPYKIYDYSVLGNPDIHWEKARKNNYGFEAALFNNLVSISYDYFTERRRDMLIGGDGRAIPPYFGTTPPAANLGKVNSDGYELEVKLDKRMGNGLHPWATLATSHTENKIVERDDPALYPSYQKQAGYAVGQYRSQVRAGFMNNWDDIYASAPLEAADNQKIPGFWNILDFNGDGAITSRDVIPYRYSGVPQNTYTVTVGAEYKGFSAMMMFYGVTNVTRNYAYANFAMNTDVVFDNLLDAWSKDNQDASAALPRWRSQGGSIGDYNLKDGSYWRLKTVEIAYTFRNEWVKKANLSSLRVYLNGNNLFFWSDLPDDREASFVGGGGGAYPTVKRINCGIEMSF